MRATAIPPDVDAPACGRARAVTAHAGRSGRAARASAALALMFAASAAGCAGAPPPPEMPPPAKEATAETPELPEHYIDRASLEVVLKEGPGWLLSQVPIEDVQTDGTFVGWRLADVPLAWQGVDIQAGDVVTAVNAMPVETPSDFWAAWTTLTVASELKVAYRRDGEERELSLPILGVPSPTVAEDLKAQQGEPPAEPPPDRGAPRQKGTVTIKSTDKPIQETMVDWSDPP
ncbi:MAG: S1C family serine protease [Myxococcota bacterium]